MEDRIESLFTAYSSMVFRVCLRYTGIREEAEDLTQEVFLRVDKGLAAFQGECPISAWIYRIAVNACLDSLRSRSRRGEIDLEVLDSIVVRNLSSGGDRELARIDLKRILDQADPGLRECLLLTLGEGLSYEDAAEITGRSVDALAKAISRFRKSIADLKVPPYMGTARPREARRTSP